LLANSNLVAKKTAQGKIAPLKDSLEPIYRWIRFLLSHHSKYLFLAFMALPHIAQKEFADRLGLGLLIGKKSICHI